jgi:hypothetical protein
LKELIEERTTIICIIKYHLRHHYWALLFNHVIRSPYNIKNIEKK